LSFAPIGAIDRAVSRKQKKRKNLEMSTDPRAATAVPLRIREKV
jgi:hypothetical protein